MEMLFVRDFAGLTGGHLKVRDYLFHTSTSGILEPVLYQTPRSRRMPDNIFNRFGGHVIDELREFPAYFVAGEDWFILDAAKICPKGPCVINLIQGLRHADRSHPLFACLQRPAVRICVSPPVASAIQPHANGTVLVIENSIELPQMSVQPLGPQRVLIAGYKNPVLARAIAALVAPFAEVDLLLDFLPRESFLARIAQSSVSIMLPLPQEGFYLPALEAMALGRGVVTPDCGGNASFCQHGVNCLMPEYEAAPISQAARLLLTDRELLDRLAAGGLSTAAQRSIGAERAAYHEILRRHFSTTP
jgi:glycosyltransferase involved in cell wall biosynthesis